MTLDLATRYLLAFRCMNVLGYAVALTTDPPAPFSLAKRFSLLGRFCLSEISVLLSHGRTFFIVFPSASLSLISVQNEGMYVCIVQSTCTE